MVWYWKMPATQRTQPQAPRLGLQAAIPAGPQAAPGLTHHSDADSQCGLCGHKSTNLPVPCPAQGSPRVALSWWRAACLQGLAGAGGREGRARVTQCCGPVAGRGPASGNCPSVPSVFRAECTLPAPRRPPGTSDLPPGPPPPAQALPHPPRLSVCSLSMMAFWMRCTCSRKMARSSLGKYPDGGGQEGGQARQGAEGPVSFPRVAAAGSPGKYIFPWYS